MARKTPPKDVIIKLIVGAGQASPSPPVGPALGSKGVKSMDFCKEFNARTAHYTTGTPIPTLVTVRPDRSFHFSLRTPPTSTLLFRAARVHDLKNRKRGAGNTGGPRANKDINMDNLANMAAEADVAKIVDAAKGGKAEGVTASSGNAMKAAVGVVSLKHVYEIARIKQSEVRLSGMGLEGLCRSVVAQAGSVGVLVVP